MLVARQPVRCLDGPAMGGHNLVADGEPQPGIVAEAILFGAVGIEALEHPIHLLRANTRSVIVHANDDIGTIPAHGDADGAVFWRKGPSIVDQIGQDLTQSTVMANDPIRQIAARIRAPVPAGYWRPHARAG